MAIRTILVEDNETIRANLIPAMTDLAGAQVIAIAETQAEAVAALNRLAGQWQLVVIDLFLKEGSGLGVLRACSNRVAQQVALVLTNYPTPHVRESCISAGADGVFDKSTELEAFFNRCSSIESKKLQG